MYLPHTLPCLLATALLLPACTVAPKPEIGGFGSVVSNPGQLRNRESREPVRPNPHMDPVQNKFGLFSLRWTEDLEKTARNPQPAPVQQEP